MNSLLILVIILLSLYIALYITGPLLIFFHELGHAIAILILTNPNKIDLYIGSYGDNSSKLNFSIGKLYFHVNPALSIKTGGMCSTEKMANNYTKTIIILLAGPLFTIVLSCILGFFVFNEGLHSAIEFYFCCLIVSAFIGLWTDLVPGTIKEHNLYNDGKLIAFTYRIRHVFADYLLARQHLLKEKNDEGIIKLRALITLFPYEEILIRQLIAPLILTKQFDEARAQLLKLKSFTEFTIDDYTYMGYLQILSDQNNEAEASFNSALEMNTNHPIALNNLGYVLVLLENYEEAKKYLEKAIKINPNLAEAYNNLGKLKLLTNLLEEGKTLIEKSIVLNPENADAYKNLGIYYSKVKNIELARFNYDKALKLDNSLLLEDYKEQFIQKT
ncbi:tetratricopeptide repeat protein [Pedobacter sp. PLR]|uniref:tetratricopeptide repeat protein n=1 Tax=Pedobacter sp. PLR TaxID=2994465 RepID=UPI0022464F5B|nr:tetratricopeptide repeat protein [Pedobacter sp. PLR]MCX2450079.1 tetratricopeptide repeat protein [Pedobacter sp. PLR]